MVDLWFFLVCAMFAAYVVLDGYDLGAGIVSPFVARTNAERKALLHTILPFWDGNEVFLVAGGATLYLAFPRLFPVVVSGFYLPVMIVLWLLMLRGLGIEMRHKMDQPLWNQLWDGAFFIASLLLVLFFGAALGNIVRGVSVDEHGEFFAPLWTDFGVGEHVGILDWYTVLVGITALAWIARHGALHVAASADGEVQTRSRALGQDLLVPTVVLGVATTASTFIVQSHIPANLTARPWLGAFALLAIVGGAASEIYSRRGVDRMAFRGSSLMLLSMFGCACAGVHPYGLLARIPSRSVLITDAAAAPYALGVGLAWWLPGMVLVIAYTIVAHRRLLTRH